MAIMFLLGERHTELPLLTKFSSVFTLFVVLWGNGKVNSMLRSVGRYCVEIVVAAFRKLPALLSESLRLEAFPLFTSAASAPSYIDAFGLYQILERWSSRTSYLLQISAETPMLLSRCLILPTACNVLRLSDFGKFQFRA